MSGGSYDYVSFKIEEAASGLRSRHNKEPHVLALADHLDAIAKVMHDVEWADSNDTAWDEKLDDAIRAVLMPGAEIAELIATGERVRAQLDGALLRANSLDLKAEVCKLRAQIHDMKDCSDPFPK